MRRDVYKRQAVQGAQMLLFLEKPHDVEQQVVKVHAIGFLLAGHVLDVYKRQGGVQAAAEGVRIFIAVGGGSHDVGIALELGASVGCLLYTSRCV